MPDFGFDGVSSSLAEFMSIFCSQLFFSAFFSNMYVTQTLTTDNTQHTGSAGCVLQQAGYNAIHSCRLPAEQEATPPASGSFSALYCCRRFLSNTYLVLVVAIVIGPCYL